VLSAPQDAAVRRDRPGPPGKHRWSRWRRVAAAPHDPVL